MERETGGSATPLAERGVMPLDVEHDASERGLVIRGHVVERWWSLDDRVRARVAGVLDGTSQPGPVSVVDGKLPDAFARDLAGGGRLFRSAFSELTRVVVSVVADCSSVDVVIACRGRHTAPFYSVIAPTLRHVRFEVAHRFALGRDHAWLEHRLHVDVRCIIAQFCGDGGMRRA